MPEYFNSSQEETNYMKKFVKDNVYPDYDTCVKIITEKENMGRDNIIMDMFAEYGEFNHNMLKKIYEDCDNESLIKECGRRIHQRGGTTAMTYNLYALLKIMLYLMKQNNKIYTHGETIVLAKHIFKQCEWKWDGIGDWKS